MIASKTCTLALRLKFRLLVIQLTDAANSPSSSIRYSVSSDSMIVRPSGAPLMKNSDPVPLSGRGGGRADERDVVPDVGEVPLDARRVDAGWRVAGEEHVAGPRCDERALVGPAQRAGDDAGAVAHLHIVRLQLRDLPVRLDVL